MPITVTHLRRPSFNAGRDIQMGISGMNRLIAVNLFKASCVLRLLLHLGFLSNHVSCLYRPGTLALGIIALSSPIINPYHLLILFWFPLLNISHNHI